MKKKYILILFFIPLLILQTGCSSTKSNLELREDYLIYIPTRPVKNNHPLGKLDLYVGARNYFKFVPNNKNLKLDISIQNGVIEKSKYSEYGYNIYTKNFKRSYLFVKHGKFLDTITFYKKNIPPPILRYKTGSIDTLSTRELKTFNSFMASLRDFSYDCIFEVYSMNIIIIHDDDKTTEIFENLSNKSPRLKWLMRRAKPNDTYIFHNVKIKVVDTEDVIIRGESIISKIVE
ncbi:hypothetical protein H7F37_03645 [Winogradskyella sp. PAMC22761]|nr:hypothetical protein H7F37_03645 [Winogradskyella sp. PAMC22761]